MNPKEKAQYLVDKIYQTTADMRYYNPPADTFASRYEPWNQAKQCALIAVEEIRENIVSDDDNHRVEAELVGNLYYWDQVKTEIKKL